MSCRQEGYFLFCKVDKAVQSANPKYHPCSKDGGVPPFDATWHERIGGQLLRAVLKIQFAHTAGDGYLLGKCTRGEGKACGKVYQERRGRSVQLRYHAHP